MKKIAITGYTNDIGSSITKAYQALGYEIVGISRSTGFDLLNPEDQRRMLDVVKDCDVFVNLYCQKYVQLDLLKSVSSMWTGNFNKLIINVTSIGTRLRSTQIENNNDYYTRYRMVEKLHWNIISNFAGPDMCLARAGIAPNDENFDAWAKELVAQTERSDYFTFEFTILKRHIPQKP